jgi:pyridoxine kinase
VKKAAVINDLSGFGKCSLTAAIPVLSALDVQCCPLATAVLTGQTGYADYACTDLTDMIPQYTHAWRKNGVHFDAIYSGYLTDSTQIAHLMDFLSCFRSADTFLLVDPVMGDDGRVYGIFSPELLTGMKELSRMADLITPNLTEACLLTGTDIRTVTRDFSANDLLAFAEDQAQQLRECATGNQDVVITGIKCRGEKTPCIYNIAATADGIYRSRSHFFDHSFSGTGDLFASVLCGCKVNGMSTRDAIELAVRFLSQGIADAVAEGTAGNDGIHFEKHLLTLIEGGTRNE